MSSNFSTSDIVTAEVSNIRAIKNRSLCSRHLDVAYPSRMPFYLYGTEQEMHIDHVILQAPSAQLSAGEVTVDIIEGNKSLFAAGLKDGLVAVTDTFPEHLMQPFTPDRLKLIFHPGAVLDVSIYLDRKTAECSGPGLCDELGEPIARATITINSNTFIDEYMINLDAPVIAAPQAPKKSMAFPATASTSQDHPLFRGYTPEKQQESTGSVQSLREIWDRALASRQFVDINSSSISSDSRSPSPISTDSTALNTESDDDVFLSPMAMTHSLRPFFEK